MLWVGFGTLGGAVNIAYSPRERILVITTNPQNLRRQVLPELEVSFCGHKTIPGKSESLLGFLVSTNEKENLHLSVYSFKRWADQLSLMVVHRDSARGGMGQFWSGKVY